MLSKKTIEFYPLWMQECPELFEKFKTEFLVDAKENGLESVRDYWQNGLYYIEAS